MSFWSWVSCSEKVTSWPAVAVATSRAASVASAASLALAGATGLADIERDLLCGHRHGDCGIQPPDGVIDTAAAGYSLRMALTGYPPASKGTHYTSRYPPDKPIPQGHSVGAIQPNPDSICGISLRSSSCHRCRKWSCQHAKSPSPCPCSPPRSASPPAAPPAGAPS